MEIPSTVAILAIAVLGLLPGVPGEKCYRLLVGRDWREDKWQTTLRLLGFSVAGLAVYTASAPYLRLPIPPYLVPAKLQNITTATANEIGIALIGHALGGVMAALVAAGGVRAIAAAAARTAYSSAWDHFVNVSVKNRWVVVSLKSGEVMLGWVNIADTSVKAEERDVVLNEPAVFNAASGKYVALAYSAVFVPGSAVASIGAVADPKDIRKIPPGEVVTEEVGNNAFHVQPS
jgi:hypothetical protein